MLAAKGVRADGAIVVEGGWSTLGLVRLAHLSDTHLGYRAYAALSPRGNNQREADVVGAFGRVVDEIAESDAEVVIHAGDVADAARIDHRIMLVAKRGLAKMTRGGERPVVVIAGNHDAPRSRRDVCFLELYRDIPGLYVVTQGYEKVDLGEVVVHAIPHDSLKAVDFGEVRPVAGKKNILTSHGVADATELFLRAVGREFPIPAETMLRDWDYVALGHWHKRGPVELGRGGTSRIWYAGSTENISFRDFRDDDGMARGWLDVEIGSELRVTPRDVPIRRMFRLPALAGEGMSPEQITGELIGRIREGGVGGAVVGQVVTGVAREIWALVDQVAVRTAAETALHYQITLRPVANQPKTGGVANVDGGLGKIDEILAGIVEETIPEESREAVATAAGSYLREARASEGLEEESTPEEGPSEESPPAELTLGEGRLSEDSGSGTGDGEAAA